MSRSSNRTIFHIDMNAFFASCEQAAHPELKGLPLIVGGDPQRRSGIVLAASYEAKAFGVKTAETLAAALKKCPDAVVVPASKGLYEEMSRKVMALFDRFTPLREKLSIDEAFLDMTGTQGLFGEPLEAAALIQKTILEELDLQSSVGISTNKLLAKMASEMRKPMGITTLYPEEVPAKLWPLPVGELYGVGRKSVEKLHVLGIRTIGDLARSDLQELAKVFGPAAARSMAAGAKGQSSDAVSGTTEDPKSIGNELTYGQDLYEAQAIRREILRLSEKVSFRLRKHGLKGRTITVKIKFHDFSVITRSKTLDMKTDSSRKIFETAAKLALDNALEKPVRLLGVSASQFDAGMEGQMAFEDFFEEEEDGLDKAMDAIRSKFGYDAITRASVLKKLPVDKDVPED